MKRTAWLQETRMLRFEEALDAWTEKRLTQEEAARLLGVCARTFRCYVDRYGVQERPGDGGLARPGAEAAVDGRPDDRQRVDSTVANTSALR